MKHQLVYSLLSEKSIENTSEISLIATDQKLLELLNDARNNKSLAHPTEPLQTIPGDIGFAFLQQLSLLVDKIIIISQGV